MIVERLTKSTYFLAVKKTDDANRLAQKYVDEIARLHRVSVNIFLDRDSNFTSLFWKTFQKAMRTKVQLSILYRPHTNGQSERTIHTLENTLRAYILN